MNSGLPTSPPVPGMPTPKSGGLLGELSPLRREGALGCYTRWWKELGDVYRIRIGWQPIYVFLHPDHVRHIHVTAAQRYIKGAAYARLKKLIGNGVVVSEAGTWRESRARMQRLFLQDAVAEHCLTIGQCVAEAVPGWERLADQQEPLDSHEQFLPLAMRVITRCLLGLDLSPQTNQTGPLLREAMAFIADSTFSLASLPLFVPVRRHRRFRQAIQALRRMLAGAMQGYGPAESAPLLDALAKGASERQLGENQIQAEVLNIFFAGFETTSLALTWALYSLALQPESMERLSSEADRVIGLEIPSSDQVSQLDFTKSVLKETLRLFPPVWAVARQVVEPDNIAGYAIPRGAVVLNSQFLTHRHPEYWDEPELFRPERFLNNPLPARHPFAYFPFGAGARTCLGENFAITEATITLAMLAARFRFELWDDIPVEPVGRGTLHPHRPVRIKLMRR